MGNLAAIGHAVMQDEVMKNTFASYAFEHFEIASYRALMDYIRAHTDCITNWNPRPANS